MRRDILLLRPLAAGDDLALLALRLLTGAFLIHGVWDNIASVARMTEFVSFLAANGFPAPSILAPFSVWMQFAIGIALCLGGLTRWSGILLAGHFAVGVGMVHLHQSFREIWPAIVLVGLGLLFATRGAGRLALDTWIGRTG